MDVLGPEVEAVATVAVVRRHRLRGSRPLAVRESPDIHVEVAGRLGGDVGDSRPVGAERRIGVNGRPGREGLCVTGAQVENLDLDRRAVVVCRVHEPATVCRVVRRRVVGGPGHQLDREPGVDVDAPYGPVHGDGHALAVRSPARIPRRGVHRRRQVEVVHVVPAHARSGVPAEQLLCLLRGRGGRQEAERNHENGRAHPADVSQVDLHWS